MLVSLDRFLVPQTLSRIHIGPVTRSAATVERATRLFLDKHRDACRAIGPTYERAIEVKHWNRLAHTFLRERRIGRGLAYLGRSLRRHPLQNPLPVMGVLLAVIDAYAGTAIVPWGMKVNERLARLRRIAAG